ncbi:MAG: hypothetical protein R3264_22660, partial [Anaerolineae bacterium]|nr:hypothetical protein [Anaerolineae bacterium]
FPNIGWINFEPTGGRPAIERSSEGQRPEFAVPPPPPLPPVDETPRSLGRTLTGWATALIWPVGLIILVSIALLAWNRYDGWQLRRLSPVGTIETLRQRLYRHGQRLGAPVVTGDTPYQFSASLIKLVEYLAMRSRWVKFIQPAGQEIEQLITLFVRTAYSPRQADLAEQTRAIETWSRLRRRLWLAWLVSWLKIATRTKSL